MKDLLLEPLDIGLQARIDVTGASTLKSIDDGFHQLRNASNKILRILFSLIAIFILE